MKKETLAPPLAKPESVLLDHFWSNVMSGKRRQISSQEIDDLIVTKLFPVSPLTPITLREELNLQQLLAEHYRIKFNLSDVGDLAEKVVFLPNGSQAQDLIKAEVWFSLAYDDCPVFLMGKACETACAHEYKTLTTADKLKLFRDPEIWEYAKTISTNGTGGFSGNAVGYGSRYFFEETGVAKTQGSYGHTFESFAEIVKEVSQRVDGIKLRVLDVGGLTGLACHDLKKYYPEFEYTNLTADEEPAMWPGINHRFAPAEYMPADFYESFDLAFSNAAWTYFLYPDVALVNLLKALSVGGYAEVSFRSDACKLPHEEMRTRMENSVSLLEKLQNQKTIHYTLNRVQGRSWPEGYLTVVKNDHVDRVLSV